MTRYKVAAIIIIVHGAIELIFTLPIWLIEGAPSVFIPIAAPPHNIEVIIGSVWGILRLISGIGLYRNLIWGYALTFINCVFAITMILLAPLGIIGGILWGIVFILICSQCFAELKAVE